VGRSPFLLGEGLIPEIKNLWLEAGYTGFLEKIKWAGKEKEDMKAVVSSSINK